MGRLEDKQEDPEESHELSSAVREAMSRAGIDTGVYLSWKGLSCTVKQV